MNQNSRSSGLPGTKIFLVEDEVLVIEDLKERLGRNGYTVVGSAASGTSAIEQIKLAAPDLVIMDVRITGELNGIEVAIILQSHFELPLPIIFLTGSSEKAFDYLRVLPDYIYVNKPFHEIKLLEAIERALNKSGSEPADPVLG